MIEGRCEAALVIFIVPNTAESATDGVTRMDAQRLTEAWGQQTEIELDKHGGFVFESKAMTRRFFFFFYFPCLLADGTG